MTSEEARAVAEVAVTAGKVVDAAVSTVSYLAKIVGGIPEDLLGVAGGDWLHHKRRRNLAQLEARTAAILVGVARERITEPSPSVLMPLLDGAKDESREELQALWANLLANAMVDGGKRVRRTFFDAVRTMEPVDAVVLDLAACVRREAKTDSHRSPIKTRMQAEAAQRGISANDMQISIEALVRMDCLGLDGIQQPYMTAFGTALLELCRPPV